MTNSSNATTSSRSGSATAVTVSSRERRTELEIHLARKLSSKSLLWFMENVLGIDCMYTHDPAVRSWIIEYGQILRNWLDHRWDVDENGALVQQAPLKILKVVPRKCFKSSTNQAALAWLLTQDPNLSMGVMAAAYDDLAIPIVKSVRAHLGAEYPDNIIEMLYGEFKNPNAWSGDTLTIQQRTKPLRDASLQAFGARKGSTGHHFDVFINDDLVTNEAMENDSGWNQRVNRLWIDQQATLNPNALVDITMTRHHDQDLAGHVIINDMQPKIKAACDGKLPDDWDPESPKAVEKYGPLAGWHVIYREAVTNPDTPQAVYNFPVIWSQKRIEDVRSGVVAEDDEASSEYSELFFWCQLQNAPQRRSDNPIQQIHIDTARGSPRFYQLGDVPKTGFVDIHCDFAFKDQEAYKAQSGDYTVAHVCVKDRGFVWRVNGYRGKPMQDQFGEQLVKLATWARNELGARVRFVSYDKLTGQGSGDKSTERWIQSLFAQYPNLNMPIIKEIPRGGRKKEAHILGTAWAWQEGWVRLVDSAPGNDPLIFQMQRIGYARPDDDSDCFADAFHPDMYNSPVNVYAEEDDDFDWVPALVSADLDLDDAFDV